MIERPDHPEQDRSRGSRSAPDNAAAWAKRIIGRMSTKPLRATLIVLACVAVLSTGAFFMSDLFKVTDPDDPRFDPARFAFADYKKAPGVLSKALLKMFPPGTDKELVESILVTKAGAIVMANPEWGKEDYSYIWPDVESLRSDYMTGRTTGFAVHVIYRDNKTIYLSGGDRRIYWRGWKGIDATGAPLKAIDPDDPRFEPEQFAFEDYEGNEHLLPGALKKAFPPGTDKAYVDRILVEAGNTSITKNEGEGDYTYLWPKDGSGLTGHVLRVFYRDNKTVYLGAGSNALYGRKSDYVDE
jgi:hypothetical protein